MHSFPQGDGQIPLAMLQHEVYSHAQIEPGSLKNFAAQLKEGAAAARQLRPRFFSFARLLPHAVDQRSGESVFNCAAGFVPLQKRDFCVSKPYFLR
jgi:hypothetical protein